MSYIRFENTYDDLRDCYEAMENEEELSDREKHYRKKLIKLCKDIVRGFYDEDEISGRDKPDNPSGEIKNLIGDLKNVIDHYANEKNPNWGTVGTLANIHESLGERLYDNYDKHLGYSKTIEEGLKRHSDASKELLSMIESDLEKLDTKTYRSGLLDLKLFFEELLRTVGGILSKIRTKGALQKDEKFYHHSMMAGYYEIQEKKLWDTISDFNSSFDSGLRKAAELMEKERQKMSSRAEFHLREKKEIFNSKIHGNWNDTIPTEEEAMVYGENFLKSATKQNTPGKPLSLREEAMELARKLGDKELMKYLETATFRMIQKRLPALREVVAEKSSNLKQKKFNKTYKYTSDNPQVIKSGTIVLDNNGLERIIDEASDKTLRLQGDKDWISINEVRFQDYKEETQRNR